MGQALYFSYKMTSTYMFDSKEQQHGGEHLDGENGHQENRPVS